MRDSSRSWPGRPSMDVHFSRFRWVLQWLMHFLQTLYILQLNSMKSGLGDKMAE